MVTSLEQWPLVIVVFVYIFVFTALGEEIGWRGFVLPRLLNRFSPFTASIILGLVWTIWHLPLFWISGDFHQQLPFSWFLLQIFGSTFIYTWLFNRTNGSLMVALVFHTSSNAAVGLLPILPADNGGSLQPLWLVVALLWVLVGIIIWFERLFFFVGPESRDEVDSSA
jgi:membrane protease YdiL (CAAX protease family)